MTAFLPAMDEPNSERIITPMPKSLVAAIDDYRFANRIPSRAEAIRSLAKAALRARWLDHIAKLEKVVERLESGDFQNVGDAVGELRREIEERKRVMAEEPAEPAT